MAATLLVAPWAKPGQCRVWNVAAKLKDGRYERFDLVGFPEETALGHALRCVVDRHPGQLKDIEVRDAEFFGGAC